VWLEGRELSLTRKEFDLLARLARSPGAVVTREDLMNDVWDENWFGSTKTLDVHMTAGCAASSARIRQRAAATSRRCAVSAFASRTAEEV
jgi:hypothetical protein